MNDKTDHDVLVKIANDVEWLRENLKEHVDHDSTKFVDLYVKHAETNKEIHEKHESLNKHINGLMIGTVLSVVILGISIFIKH